MNSDPALLKTTESEEVGMRPSGGDNILCEYLRQAPLTLALWRAFECRALKELDLPRPVLDLGCGDGIFGSLLFREGADVGLDASFAETRLAKARGVYRGIVAGNIENLPFTDTCMSSVVSNCVIEHVDRLESALSSIHRILRHGGIFAFTTPSDHFNEYGLLPHLLQTIGLRSLGRPWSAFRDRYHHHVNMLDAEGWKRTLSAAGFEMVHQRYLVPERAARMCDLAILSAAPAMALKAMVGGWVLPLRGLTLPFLLAWCRCMCAEQSERGGGLLHVARKP